MIKFPDLYLRKNLMSANASDPTNMSSNTTQPNTATRWRNLIVVFAAMALSVAVVLGLQTQSTTASLSELAETATPLEVATTNGKPTLVEFYANWCTTCQAMAADNEELRQEYGDRVNFVMLNVDNTKWLPEMTEYEVDGIPHFVYLNESGTTVSQSIGEVPRAIMAQDLEALIAGADLQGDRDSGQVSSLDARDILAGSSGDDPRSHGADVVN